MSELAKHIEILLLDNDCVIVPDFGGFMAHHVESVYDEREQLFLPPTRTLGFNPQLKINDSLLVQSYVESLDVSYPEALQCVESDVCEMTQSLINEGFYELNGIGTLTMGDEGIIDFEPCQAGILTPDLYGLFSFEMPKLQPFAESRPKVSAVTKREVKPMEEPVAKESITALIDADEECGAKLIEMPALYKAVAAIALFIMMLVSVPTGDCTYRQQQLGILDATMLQKVMPHMEIIGEMPSCDVKDEVEEPEVEAPVVEQAETAEPSYVIVMASRVTRANGEAFAEKLRSNGVKDARLLERANGMKVVSGAYATEEEAREALRSLHDNPDYADCWVLKVQ